MLTVYGTDLKNRTGSSNSFAMSTVLMPIDGHLGKTTRSSVFVSKSYCEASEIGLECRQYVLFDNFKRKLLNYFVGLTVYFYCCQRRPYWSDHWRPYRRFQWCHKKEGETYSFDKKAFNENCYNNKVLL